MSDEVDATAERMELEEALKRKYSHQPIQEVAATGHCLNCGEPTPQRWCDVFCRNDWQARQRK